MKTRLLIVISSLVVLVGIGAIAWVLISSFGVSDQEDLAQPPKTESELAQIPEDDPPTADADVVDLATKIPDPTTEAAVPVETPTSQVQATPTEPQAAESQTTEPQASQVEPSPTQSSDVQPTATQTSDPQPIATPSVEVQVTESQPTTEPAETAPVVIRQGQFKDADSVHTGSGTATIYQKPDGSYLLSFENFAVCCGPDLYVFLANNPSPTSHTDLGDYLELSSLKSSTGNQEYKISADTDLSQINSIVIYCKPFQVIISTATLG